MNMLVSGICKDSVSILVKDLGVGFSTGSGINSVVSPNNTEGVDMRVSFDEGGCSWVVCMRGG